MKFVILGVVALVLFGVIGALDGRDKGSSTPVGSTVNAGGHYGPETGKVVYSSRFGYNEGWDVGAGDGTARALRPGHYTVSGTGNINHFQDTPYVTAHDGISVTATVSGYAQQDLLLGAACESTGPTPAIVYQLLASPTGQWLLQEGRLPGKTKVLLTGVATPLGTTASLEISCVITNTGASHQTTQLVAYLDGNRLAAIGNSIPKPFVGGYVPGLVLGTNGPKVSATFTSITVRSLTPSG